MAEMFVKIIIAGMLFICAIQDIRKKKILLWIVLLCTALIGVCVFFCNSYTLPERMGGMAVGAVVIIISLATAGKIGMGDGVLLCATGLGLGFWNNLELFAVALLIAAVVSIVLLILRLADRKKSIPFVPFLFAGFLFMTYAGR